MFRQGQVSIAKRLAAALLASLFLASCLALAVNYHLGVSKGKRELAQKADDYFEVLQKSLSRPLWHYDADTIRLTCQAFSQNELVALLRISDSTGKAIFSLGGPDQAGLIKRQKDIKYKNQLAGTISLGLTTLPQRKNIREMLLSSSALAGFLLVVIFLGAGLLMRGFLKKPLQQLSDMAQAYGTGQYLDADQEPPAREFRPVVRVMREMGGKIQRQMDELRAAEQRFRSIVENSLNGIYQSTPEGRFLAVNPAFAHMLGYQTPAEAMEKITHIGQQLYAEPGQREMLIDRLTQNGSVSDFECQFRRRDGRLIWVSLDVRCVADEQGRLLFLEGFIIDVTERKEAEQALLEAYEGLEERVKERTAELERALREVKTLSGLLPICANCKKIRDDKGYWNQIEEYIRDRSEAEFSHSICPDCARRLYPEIYGHKE